MARGTRSLLVLSIVGAMVVTGGAAILFGAMRSAADPQSVTGLIVGVDSEGIDKVRGFTLRTGDRSLVDFAIGNLENGGDFPPGHLAEHQSTAQTVRVWYRIEGDTNVAVRLEDAP